MAGSAESSRKRKTFQDLEALASRTISTKPILETGVERSDEDSDALEAVTLTGGRAAEKAKANALKAH